jgi:HAE1 family hydrophobic/amphiphilic exporter-1
VTQGLQKVRDGIIVSAKAGPAARGRRGRRARDEGRPMSRFFIRRPIVAIVISILFVVGGAVMVFRLPVAQFPEIAPPQIETTAMYTGADALTVEQSVATPIDAQVNGAKRMIYMQAISGNDGTMTLQVSFETGTDIDIDQVQVQNRLAQGASEPAHGREQLRPHDDPDGRHPAARLHDQLAEQDVGPELPLELRRHQRQGRARPRARDRQVKIFGAANYAMRVWVEPDAIAKLGLTVTDLVNAITAQNVVNPAGTLGGEPAPPGRQFTYTVRAAAA